MGPAVTPCTMLWRETKWQRSARKTTGNGLGERSETEGNGRTQAFVLSILASASLTDGIASAPTESVEEIADMIQVILPAHLRTLAQVPGEITLEIEGLVTVRSILDALESRYPMLQGTIRDHVTPERRAGYRQSHALVAPRPPNEHEGIPASSLQPESPRPHFSRYSNVRAGRRAK